MRRVLTKLTVKLRQPGEIESVFQGPEKSRSDNVLVALKRCNGNQKLSFDVSPFVRRKSSPILAHTVYEWDQMVSYFEWRSMLKVDRANLEEFDGGDLANLLASSGWEAVLPNALQDSQLLRVAEQLRGLLSGQDAGSEETKCSAALVMTLLLLSKVQSKKGAIGDAIEVELATLHEAMSLLSFSVDREIANRVLNQRDDPSDGALVSAMEKLTRRRTVRRVKA